MQIAKAQLAAGEKWPEFIAARETEMETAHRQFAAIDKEFQNRRRAAIKAHAQEHAGAANAYAHALENIARLEREVALAELESLEGRQTVQLLTKAAETESDKGVAEWLHTYAGSSADKLKAIAENQERKRQQAATLRSELTSLQKKMATTLGALAV